MIKTLLYRIVLVVLLIIPVVTNAQSKGYLGKRFLVQSDFYLSRNSEHSFKTSAIFIPRLIFSPGIEYVIGKKSSVGVALNLFSFKFDPSETIEYMYQDSLPNPLVNNGIGFNIFFKQYLFKHGHAPYGPFLKLKFDWNAIRIDAHTFGVLHSNIYSLNVEIGYDYMIGNRVRLSWGTYFGLTNDIFNLFNTLRPHILENAENKYFKDFLIGTRVSISGLLF